MESTNLAFDILFQPSRVGTPLCPRRNHLRTRGHKKRAHPTGLIVLLAFV